MIHIYRYIHTEFLAQKFNYVNKECFQCIVLMCMYVCMDSFKPEALLMVIV